MGTIEPAGGPAATDLADGLTRGADDRVRCWWPGADPLYVAYHDEEWGRPVADDRRLFEKLCLEGFQSGLSWLTILRKREAFRRAFADFDARALIEFDDADRARLLADAGIVRHRGKIEAVLTNARRCLELVDREGSLAAFVWRFEPDPASRPARLTRAAASALAATPESTALSKELRRRGWAFVGPTTCYAFMQSMGIVNDHLEGYACRDAVEAERARFVRPR
ncbi:DNA-3-methyladenine glycosylase I [Siculibacillus lacustris]|uniref:DNA-3-methyladenine glycosylase I n=1 Tax=Siculibacillus lacustris TaxID=1549641 RepID=A0A4Q9VNI2_9HYPH|nr:DNA-3-methyladenine glycosylase I [Siculibacillus lacustris]TBW37218.1 DNA-3-methyladenine glycosylase I [Siculibacillus lacustris]